MMHTAIMKRYNNDSKIQKYDRTFEAKSVCRKILLGTVKSTHSDMDHNEAKMKEGVLQVKDYLEKLFQKMKIVQTFYQ
jgi:hypothetical protein